MKAFWLLAAALASPAAAAPCDQYQDPLAYNACLARQGAAARALHVGPAPAIGASAKAGRVRGRIVVVRPHGLSELVFSPGK